MIIVITGVTGVGKTEIGYKIAKKINGELISADSRQIYKYINIASNKKIFKDIKTHLIDIRNPNETYSIYEFRSDSKSVIKDIQTRNKIPIIIGGSILYIKSLIYNMTLGSKQNKKLRDKLSLKSIKELQDLLQKKDISFFETLNNSDKNNKRRLIRYIENTKNLKRGFRFNNEYIVFEIQKETNILSKSIEKRTKNMIKNGLVKETKHLLDIGFNEKDPALNMIGTKETVDYIKGRIDLEDLENQINIHTKQYIKKQKTFLKSIKEMEIIQYEQALDLIPQKINKSQF